MSVQLESSGNDGTIRTSDMVDGQIGITPEEDIIQRHDNVLLCWTVFVVIGQRGGKSFTTTYDEVINFRVRLLRKGEKIVITNN